MSNQINDGGPAFPDDRWQAGMTLRDYFAAAALQGLMAQYDPEDELEHHIAKWSYAIADAVLKAREVK